MTTRASCSRRSPIAWRRRPPSTFTSACGASSGATPPPRRSPTSSWCARSIAASARPRVTRPARITPRRRKLWQLLDVERSAGISLTDSYAMYPTAAVSGWYIAHPQARYFAVGKIDRESGRGLRAAQGTHASPKRSAGWGRISATSRSRPRALRAARHNVSMRNRRNQASVPRCCQDDVTFAQLANCGKVAEAAARDAFCEFLAREIAAQHLVRSSIQYSTCVPFTTMREL